MILHLYNAYTFWSLEMPFYIIYDDNDLMLDFWGGVRRQNLTGRTVYYCTQRGTASLERKKLRGPSGTIIGVEWLEWGNCSQGLSFLRLFARGQTDYTTIISQESCFSTEALWFHSTLFLLYQRKTCQLHCDGMLSQQSDFNKYVPLKLLKFLQFWF